MCGPQPHPPAEVVRDPDTATQRSYEGIDVNDRYNPRALCIDYYSLVWKTATDDDEQFAVAVAFLNGKVLNQAIRVDIAEDGRARRGRTCCSAGGGLSTHKDSLSEVVPRSPRSLPPSLPISA